MAVAGDALEWRILEALKGALGQALRNPAPERAVQACTVRLDPPDTEPGQRLWTVDIVSAGGAPGNAEDTAADHHIARVDVWVCAPPGREVINLFWHVHQVVVADAWWPPAGVQDLRPIDMSGVLRQQVPFLVPPSVRTLSYEIEFWSPHGDPFNA
jgi:hypothetical protein